MDMQFRTPLHWAAVLGLTEVVGILMEYGADPNVPDAVGATGLHYAVSGTEGREGKGREGSEWGRHMQWEPQVLSGRG